VNLDDLPPLREVIRRHGLTALRSLGQNFLLDLNLTARIARSASPLEGFTLIEVGPGPGGLTRALLALGADRVLAVERDRRFLPALDEIGRNYPGRLAVVEADALGVDFASLVPGPAKIAANLPYNVATPLLFRWLETEPWPPWYTSLTLMFQREVAERIVAPVGSRSYGRLAVFAQWRTEPRLLFDVHPSAFTPPPKVTSSVVQIVPRPEPLACDPGTLQAVVAAAFGQRRKMLRSSLKSLGVATEAVLEAAGIEPQTRAQQVDVAGFVRLARAVAAECR
jgi:16S rRNA (adenine1518-N6/adenine1519-N6)-dimethyltransferase